jgi:hypothetical protein
VNYQALLNGNRGKVRTPSPNGIRTFAPRHQLPQACGWNVTRSGCPQLNALRMFADMPEHGQIVRL